MLSDGTSRRAQAGTNLHGLAFDFSRYKDYGYGLAKPHSGMRFNNATPCVLSHTPAMIREETGQLEILLRRFLTWHVLSVIPYLDLALIDHLSE